MSARSFPYDLSVYVAASSDELSRAKFVMDLLRRMGVTVTSTWAESIEADGGITNEGLDHATRVARSNKCIAEIRAADVLLLLVPRAPSGIGSGWEAGAAQIMGRHIIASGPTERSIFCATAVEFAEDWRAVEAIVEMARERR